MYAQQYPDRHHPNRTYVQKLKKSLIERGSFNRTNAVQQQPRINQHFNEVIENQVLAYILTHIRLLDTLDMKLACPKLIHKIFKKKTQTTPL